MSAPTATVGDHVAAILEALNAALPEGRKAYRRGAVARMDEKPRTYLEVAVARRYLPDPRVSPGSQVHGWRATATWVADFEHNADQLEARASDVLEGLVPDIDGLVATPLVHELTEATEQTDTGSWTGFVEFTYTTSPAA